MAVLGFFGGQDSNRAYNNRYIPLRLNWEMTALQIFSRTVLNLSSVPSDANGWYLTPSAYNNK